MKKSKKTNIFLVTIIFIVIGVDVTLVLINKLKPKSYTCYQEGEYYKKSDNVYVDGEIKNNYDVYEYDFSDTYIIFVDKNDMITNIKREYIKQYKSSISYEQIKVFDELYIKSKDIYDDDNLKVTVNAEINDKNNTSSKTYIDTLKDARYNCQKN